MREVHLAAVAVCLLFGACTDETVILVDLKTDLVAVDELRGVATTILDDSGAELHRVESLAQLDHDYVAGRRVAEVSGLEPGDYAVVVSALGERGVLAQRRVRVSLTDSRAVTVLVSRDAVRCNPATCDADSTCGVGEDCIDDRCAPESPATCEAQCMSSADCTPRADCSIPVCVSGVCLYGARDGACPTDAWCNPDEGCIPRSMTMPDSSIDPCGVTHEDCDGIAENGCEQSILDDPRNCGGCGVRCDGGENGLPGCSDGVCRLSCTGGFGDCDGDQTNGCETETSITEEHCGTCGSVCPATLPICAGGDCVVQPFRSDGSEGELAPTADMTLSAGVHHFTTIDIPAGVTITADGSGVLELYATGDVMIDGIIDLSGGAGGDGSSGGCCAGSGGGSTGTGIVGADATTGCQPAGTGGTGGPGFSSSSVATRCGEGGRNGGGAGGAHGSGGGGGGAAGGGGGGGDSGRGGAVPGAAGGLVDGFGAEPGFPMYSGADGTSDWGRGGGGASIGAPAIMDLAMATTFGTGSGGGGGGGIDTRIYNFGGGGGGGGGGALRISSGTRIVTGPGAQLSVRGGAGGPGMGGGGGGSGGAIFLVAPELRLMGDLDARGGAGGSGRGTGGAAGLGRIRLSVSPSQCTLSMTSTPPVLAGCTETNELGAVYIGSYPN